MVVLNVRKLERNMTASSPDQQGGAPASQQHTGKRRLWVSLLISISVFFVMAVILLGLLVLFKVIPLQWFAPLSIIFGSVLGFVKTTLSDKDFQDALRKRLSKMVAGENEKKGDEAAKNAAPNITINFTPNITNTNTNTARSQRVCCRHYSRSGAACSSAPCYRNDDNKSATC
jgi:hypothetical protein